MNETLLHNELVRFEGCKYAVYKDTLGLLTVGVGHRTDLPERTQVDLSQVQQWYQDDVQAALQIARRIYPNFNEIDEVRQRVLTQLAFNMGNKLLQFKRMNAAIRIMNWTVASDELQASKWYGQVGSRGPETCFAMRSGLYGFE